MKKSLATSYSPTLEMPLITKTLPRHFTNRKAINQAEELVNNTPPPTEETINYLNRIGNEYPFCVYYKHRANDPL